MTSGMSAERPSAILAVTSLAWLLLSWFALVLPAGPGFAAVNHPFGTHPLSYAAGTILPGSRRSGDHGPNRAGHLRCMEGPLS